MVKSMVSVIVNGDAVAETGAGLLISLPNKANTRMKPKSKKSFMAGMIFTLSYKVQLPVPLPFNTII